MDGDTARRQKERGLLEFKLVADLAVFPQEGHIEGKIKAFLASLSLWFNIVRTVCSGCRRGGRKCRALPEVLCGDRGILWNKRRGSKL